MLHIHLQPVLGRGGDCGTVSNGQLRPISFTKGRLRMNIKTAKFGLLRWSNLATNIFGFSFWCQYRDYHNRQEMRNKQLSRSYWNADFNKVYF